MYRHFFKRLIDLLLSTIAIIILIVPMFFISLIIIINIALIKAIGIWAAALSTLLAFLIMSIYRYFDVQKYIKLKLDKKLSIFLLLLITICTGLYYVNSLPAIIANIIISVVTSIYINRGFIKTTAKAIKAKFLN
jgi:hypothetical protein